MISEERLRELMELTISESEKSVSEDESIHPMVGAVITDEFGQVIVKAHRGERGKGDHAEFIAISKAKEAGFSNFEDAVIFATLEPCTHRGHDKTACAERIVNAGFRQVYIGTLDPNPVIVGHGETYLRNRIGITVERFPSDLERQIRKINKDFCELFISSHLPSNSLYLTVRVSDTILRKLHSTGVSIKYLPSDSEYTLRDLAAYIIGKGKFVSKNSKEILTFLEDARATAFDEKYCNYTYENDARRIEERWKKEFQGIMKRFHIYDYPKKRLLNVGIGNGIEGIGLFDNCENFIGVDIAPESLKYAQSRFPRATFYQNSAETLENIESASQEIYVSFRTYQSSFFDIHESIRQAYRVLMPGGIIVISIANAYLEGDTFIKGLLPHGSKMVDQEQAHELLSFIRKNLIRMSFEDIGVHSGKAEEYLFARKRF